MLDYILLLLLYFRNPIALRLAMASVFDYIPKRQCGPGYIRFGRRCLKIPVPR